MNPPRAVSRVDRAATTNPRRGFTLVELLAVMGIIVVLIVLIAPAVNTLVRGPLVTQSVDAVVGLLNQARQTATTRNAPVEVRFYQYGDPSQPGESAAAASSGKYRAMQLCLVGDDARVTPLAAVVNLPKGVIADSGPTISTLLASTQQKTWTAADPQVAIPRGGTAYNCCVFRFRPDGSTDLPLTGTWFLTLHNVIDGDGRTTPPANYATVQIDPFSGETTVYRP